MKLFTNILMILCFANFSGAQSNDFENLWNEVSKYESEGLPKSAIKVVETIAELAKTKNNTSQQIKALLHKSKYMLTLEEEAQLKIVEAFKAEISKSKSPTKNILENMLATMYWQYFQNHRYTFYNRTNTDDKVSDDFRTWDLQTLFDEIQLYYDKSLQNGLILQQTQLSEYKTILNEQTDSKLFRPTLYDLLSHNALKFYKTPENSISKPSYAFKIDNATLLGPSKAFTAVDLQSKDSTSLQLQALKIYQDLILFHSKDSNPQAFVDIDIERLNYVKQYATFEDKNGIYEQTLMLTSKRFQSSDLSGLYNFELASLWKQQGSQYNTTSNSDVRWKLKDAVELCETVIGNFPISKASDKCRTLISQIKTSSIGITTETVLPVNTYAKFLVNYSNIDILNFQVYKVSTNKIYNFNRLYKPEDKLKFLNKLSTYKSWSSNLKNEGDFLKHTTEIILPRLENGHYILLAKVSNDAKTFATQSIQVTDFSIIEKSTNEALLFQIIDRNNGAPISGVTANLKYAVDHNNSHRSKTLTSDEKGEIRLPKTASNYYKLNITLTKGDHSAYFDNYYSYKYNERSEKKSHFKSFLFSDRSIYRPGQTVFFKAIIIESNKGVSNPLTDENVFATLYNVNGEKISDLDLVTNEYGSVAGEFVLPSSGLNGQHFIEIYSSAGLIKDNHYFLVEEYKRPKFETTFDPISETYKVNDSVSVNGKALAYSGSSITDAKVVYRVVRKVQYPSWYYWYRPWFNSEPQEISHGETTSNDKGEFEIPFVAIPDQSSDKSSFPIFQYEVTADVTDINGETRSATTTIRVGYHALNAKISIAERLDKTKKDRALTISTKNLNGEFVPAEGTIKIFKLAAPNRVLRPRPWNAPDYQVIPKEEFLTKFPHEAYLNEQNPIHWEKGKLVFEDQFDTKSSKKMSLGNIKKWTSGQYIILLESQDEFGQRVTDEARTILYSDNDKTLSDQQLFSITTNKKLYNPGDLVELTLASAAHDITATVTIEKHHEITNTYIVPLSNSKKTIKILVNNDDVGGFAIHYSLSAFNKFVGSKLLVNVPYPKSDLEIETKTFRDKLEPGTDETWSFKIKGPKGEKVSAEILASMYDMSLDQFNTHEWRFNPIAKPGYYSRIGSNANQCYGIRGFQVHNQDRWYSNNTIQQYDQLNWFGFYFGNWYLNRRLQGVAAGVQVVEDMEMEMDEVVVTGFSSVSRDEMTNAVAKVSSNSVELNETESLEGEPKNKFEDTESSIEGIKIRKNLQETTFFFPQLHTDEDGHVSFSFTSSEALTKWKLQLLAHTKTMKSAVTSLESVTQKELMVVPYVPRFLRQGDKISISTKIVNLSEKLLSGKARIVLTDAVTNEDITSKLIISTTASSDLKKKYKDPETSFTLLPPQGNRNISWLVSVPEDVQAMHIKVIAITDDYSDGEQNTVPILSNRMLVTETLPMWIKSNESRTFTLDKLRTTTSTSLKHHKLTLEITSNPAWYAVQALPYLMEYPHECNEQTFSRYYANSLASHIANSNPKIQEVFNQWKNADVLISNLEKNQELKSIIIQETPWLRDAQSETEQKKRIALLFDLNKMKYELDAATLKLKSNQMNNGAWPWFKGGRANRYITQHIITGFAHLKKLNVSTGDNETAMIKKAMNYLDAEFIKEYKDIRKYNPKAYLSADHLTNSQLQYLYLRSFLQDDKPSIKVSEIMDYYYGQIQKHWLNKPLYSKGLMALISHRRNDEQTTNKILKSLKENSITSEELGMYWKENTSSWYWYQAPIETQALMIEAFSEIQPNNLETVDNLKIWLLKNKQTNQWKTTKATTEAVYALLLQGSDWLSVTELVDVVIGGKEINPSKLKDVELEAGTGYYKTSWSSEEINPAMASVELNKKGEGIAWGSLYWQYFEDLDKITSAETPLKLKKKLFKKTNTDTGEQITEITNNTQLNIGDLVRVRIELRSDRNMEFIHMKDMRASGLEPINVLSQYKWQDGLGYYESTKDASTNFFFDYLPKGVYVFEYDLRVTNAGDMSNGISTIQSMYAPEFSSHSEGVRVSVHSN